MEQITSAREPSQRQYIDFSKPVKKCTIKQWAVCALIFSILILIIVAIIFAYSDSNSNLSDDSDPKFQIVSRSEWSAKPPSDPLGQMPLPVSILVIIHTIGKNCTFKMNCIYEMQYLQNFHMTARNFSDIGYNFLVGGDGEAYEGRGWDKIGAHTLGYNARSIGLAFMGTFDDFLPPTKQMVAAKHLIKEGVVLGMISEDYQLYGHKQLIPTTSPGNALYEEIKKWKNFDVNETEKLHLESRSKWLARPSSGPIEYLKHPVNFIIICHTATDNCTDEESCAFEVKTMQTFHMESRNWYDIAYNFLVGGDGSIYEGRGWDKVGAHTEGFNTQSLGLAFIGTFNDYLPPERQLLAAKQLIQEGIEIGKISKDYKLYGYRQLIPIPSPGNMLYDEIKTWPHFALELHVVRREEWLAQPSSGSMDSLAHPVPNVIIIHTLTKNCTNNKTCMLSMRTIQTFHMESRNYSDIGYNFLVGGDGFVYEGRGWNTAGAHTIGYNGKSIGLAFIGTFNNFSPPEGQLLAARQLIQEGITLGKISKDYKLYGHRQLTQTLSPGDALFAEIKTWPHFANNSHRS